MHASTTVELCFVIRRNNSHHCVLHSYTSEVTFSWRILELELKLWFMETLSFITLCLDSGYSKETFMHCMRVHMHSDASVSFSSHCFIRVLLWYMLDQQSYSLAFISQLELKLSFGPCLHIAECIASYYQEAANSFVCLPYVLGYNDCSSGLSGHIWAANLWFELLAEQQLQCGRGPYTSKGNSSDPRVGKWAQGNLEEHLSTLTSEI